MNILTFLLAGNLNTKFYLQHASFDSEDSSVLVSGMISTQLSALCREGQHSPGLRAPFEAGLHHRSASLCLSVCFFSFKGANICPFLSSPLSGCDHCAIKVCPGFHICQAINNMDSNTLQGFPLHKRQTLEKRSSYS